MGLLTKVVFVKSRLFSLIVPIDVFIVVLDLRSDPSIVCTMLRNPSSKTGRRSLRSTMMSSRSPDDGESRTNAVFRGRILFLLVMSCVAAVLGTVGY
jgi:hypothetical protein